MKERLLYLLKTYAVTVLLFIAAKVVFMRCNGAGHGVTPGDYSDVVRHGLSLDLSTALYFLIVPFLACMASVWLRVPRWVLKVYYAVVALAFALAFVADTSLYQFWGFKLDASCLQYLSQPEGITQSVSTGYLLLRLLLTILLTGGIYLLYNLRFCSAWCQRPDSQPSVKRKAVRTLLFILLIPLLVVGIRGGLSESTTNIGQVYYSQNQFLNHAAVNPVFNFLYSASHQLGDLSQYHFMDDDECQRLTADVYTTSSTGSDTLLTTPRPDIVIILMESAGEQFASAMPHLQQLKQEGICFTQCYANSWRTDRGTLCTLSGYPSFPSISVMKMPEKSRLLPGIAGSLKAQGYATSYLYGGDINFTNMRSYLIATGWEQLTSMDDYSAADRSSAEWGVRDDITFQTLYEQIAKVPASLPTGEETPADQPEGENPPFSTSAELRERHLWGYSTLSSHEPWDVPLHRHDDEVLNAFAYLDDCLYDFINKVRATPAWQNLLIILTADHGINYRQIDQSRPREKNHIPMLWLGGAVRQPRTVDALCNQSDLAATLLGQLALPHDDFLFSRDVLSRSYTYPTAVNNYNNAQWIVDSTGHVLYDFDARHFIVADSPDADRLLRVSKAMLQRTTDDLQK